MSVKNSQPTNDGVVPDAAGKPEKSKETTRLRPLTLAQNRFYRP